MLEAGVALERGVGGFGKMFNADSVLPLKALGYFQDGDLPTLPKAQQNILRKARDHVVSVPDVAIIPGLIVRH
jgi:hypothetical protein